MARDDAPAMIGPHAVIHAVIAMRERLGEQETNAILANSQIAQIPTGDAMIPEMDVLRLHRWLSLREPLDCFVITQEAARRTADYIIANRIPSMAVRLLQALPPALSGALLMRAIRQHAWTFIGAGRIRFSSAWEFEIDRSGADDPILLPESLLQWYAGVFEGLYRRLVSPGCRCELSQPASEMSQIHSYRISS